MRIVTLQKRCLWPLLLLTACAPAEQQTQQVWPAPAEVTAWQGYELAGVGGMSAKGSTAERWLALHCMSQPERRLERDYWSGADWDGGAEWTDESVTYQPNNNHPDVALYTFTLEEAQRRIGCGS